MKPIDLSHTIEHGMITYRGLPAPLICDYLSRKSSQSLYDEGTEFHIARIDMAANTGTYLDSPFHRYAEGKDLSELPLSSLAGLVGVVIRWDGNHPYRLSGTRFEKQSCARADRLG
ncbi:MAG: arylformamidase [Verrucomicrobiales bacterium]|jgi:kynurenine formamidase